MCNNFITHFFMRNFLTWYFTLFAMIKILVLDLGGGDNMFFFFTSCYVKALY